MKSNRVRKVKSFPSGPKTSWYAAGRNLSSTNARNDKRRLHYLCRKYGLVYFSNPVQSGWTTIRRQGENEDLAEYVKKTGKIIFRDGGDVMISPYNLEAALTVAYRYVQSARQGSKILPTDFRDKSSSRDLTSSKNTQGHQTNWEKWLKRLGVSDVVSERVLDGHHSLIFRRTGESIIEFWESCGQVTYRRPGEPDSESCDVSSFREIVRARVDYCKLPQLADGAKVTIIYDGDLSDPSHYVAPVNALAKVGALGSPIANDIVGMRDGDTKKTSHAGVAKKVHATCISVDGVVFWQVNVDSLCC